ncbi:Uncharacterised protein [Mycobacteroides abscessus subsp. abscessus]|nr:hypothetical protein [Mycobacteroides abscessus]CPZ56301.1 Uncharacterised protein [Mycobacteroides abscessus]SHT54343.1 Uncharacterised protein [Mycobacteroides abscessus subsp. abscessus]SIN41444.1 Uncharacterised protein [Mycobacteroides abscessus subsp. abscessus]SKV38980.1 Uncharacterised protein [Mycobacteroides abscessus subsp. abscessus]
MSRSVQRRSAHRMPPKWSGYAERLRRFANSWKAVLLAGPEIPVVCAT